MMTRVAEILEQELGPVEAAERIAALEETLRWLVHLGHAVGRGGGRPEPGEWKDALEQGRKVLAP